MAEVILCSRCGLEMPREEVIDGQVVDWTNEEPVCRVCRGVPGAKPPPERKKDILGGFPWKRDDNGNKVPR